MERHKDYTPKSTLTVSVDVIIGVIGIGSNYLLTACSKNVVSGELNVKQITKLLLLPLEYKRCKRKMKRFKRHQKRRFKKRMKSPLNDEEVEGENSSDDEPDAESSDEDYDDDPQDAYFNQENLSPILQKGNKMLLSGNTPRVTSIESPLSQTVKRTTEIHEIKRKKFRKFERSVKHLFNSKCFYYSDTIDLTNIDISDQTIGKPFNSEGYVVNEFFWNYNLIKPMIHFGESFVKPIICGFVDSIPLKLQSKSSDNLTINGKVILISKKSNKRAGWRYMRRGIDDDGKVANFVQTDQILIIGKSILKFTIIRGSIPLFFSQDPINPIIEIERDFSENNSKFLKHMSNLREMYNWKDISLLSLIETNLKTEGKIGKYYEKVSISNCYSFTWFDFHKICSKLRYENVKLLFNYELSEKLINYGYDDVSSKQRGIIRVNCIDCLDRTNIVQKSICQFILDEQLNKYGLEIIEAEEFKYQYGIIWFNNGDNLSSMYANTQAMKGDFTKFGKRKYSGLLNDGILSIVRYYYGVIVDYYQQVVIDFLLGDINETLFCMYESILDNMDPNILNKLEVLKRDLIISNLNFQQGEILLGSWWVKSTFVINKLRKQPMIDIILILTNENTFLVKLGNDGIREFKKIENLNVREVSIGDYFNDTVTKLSRDSQFNKGVLISFSNGYDSVNIIPDSAKRTPSSTKNLQLGCTLDRIGIKFPFNMPHENVAKILGTLRAVYVNGAMKESVIVSIERARKDTGYFKVINYELKRLIWGGR